MKALKNRERILQASVELFNQSGVVAITTNHIAQHLAISPGNLYFHFRNKEEIALELFDRMCRDTYEVWKLDEESTPLEFIEKVFEVFWRYRFFHREMYHLRRKDPNLARHWRSHLKKTVRLLQTTYGHWVRKGIMRKINDPGEMQMIADVVLITSSSFFQFYESPEKPGTKKTLKQGIEHITRLLLPYHTEPLRSEIEPRLRA